MINFVQIILGLVVLHGATSTPIFGEFKFKRNFEVEHKPFILPPFKPIEFIKEIVTPLGKFGMKHGIGKRDLDSIKTEDTDPEKIPLLEPPANNRYEVSEPPMGPVLFSPSPVAPVSPDLGPVVEITPKPYHFKPVAPIVPKIHKPIQAPPHPPVVITPPTAERPPPKGFNTDIAREEAINEYLRAVERQVVPIENTIVPEKPPVELPPPPPPVEQPPLPPPVEQPPPSPPVEQPPPNPLIRGSRLALYFGNILLDILSQFIGGGRLGGLLDRPVTI